ncbi:MAG: rod shape-determining protein MreD [Bacteroidetes Order II. Incertae sedis bacterium]|nr:rod shape-determining protein MreD [Bacteroidetes Order II. bacterium]
MPPIVRHILTGILVLLLDWLLFRRLPIMGAYPDVILIYLIFIALQYGRTVGMFAGFVLGFITDAIYQTWGVSMFIKTLVGFLMGFFPPESRDRPMMMPQQVFSAALIISLFHNGLMVIFLVLTTQVRSGYHIGTLWLGSALYTAIVGTLISLFLYRTR